MSNSLHRRKVAVLALALAGLAITATASSAAGRSAAPILNTILSGTGAPKTSLGHNGDFYIDRANFSMYGPKIKNKWPQPFSIKGPAGASAVSGKGSSSGADISTGVASKGEAGAIGPRGLTGAQGAPGVPGIPGTVGAKGDPGAVGPAGPAGANGFGSPGANGANGAAGATGAKGDTGPSQVKVIALQSAGGGTWTISSSAPAKSSSASFGNLEANKNYFFQIHISARLASYVDPTSIIGAEVVSDTGTAVTSDISYGFGKFAASLSDTYYRFSIVITGTISTGSVSNSNLIARVIDGSGWSSSIPNTLTGRAYIQEVGSLV
jgi:hypothetical protein